MIGIVKDFVKQFVIDKGCPHEVLEVGSRNVNGSVRNLFHSSYIGIDIEDGPEVQIVMDAMNIKDYFQPESFDLVMCLETLEHVKDPIRIVENMRWALRKGGWMLITTPGIAHSEHDWPSDYYRFFENTYRDVFFKDFENTHFETKFWDTTYIENNTMFPCAVMGYGQKGGK